MHNALGNKCILVQWKTPLYPHSGLFQTKPAEWVYCCVVLLIPQIQVQKKLAVDLVGAKIKELLKDLISLSNVIVCAIWP
jgi:hypothetical protein